MVILYSLYENAYQELSKYPSTKGMKVYLNSTNRCTAACTFCLRNTKEMSETNTLWLKEEPTVEQIIAEFDKYDVKEFKEVIFCGFGEPLIRHQDLMKVAKYLKERAPEVPIRINTNGLSSKYHGYDITEDMVGLIDTVSVSLNAPTAKEYQEITRARYGEESFEILKDFTRHAKQHVPHVVMTVVDIIGEEKIKQAQAVCDELGVTLRVRPFEV